MKTKKRKITLEDVEKEGMGKRAKARVLKNPNEEFEELDLSTYPEEILSIPTSDSYSKAEQRYQEQLEHARKYNLDVNSIIKRHPKIGLCTNELVTVHTKAIQELLTRVESLEAK